MRHETLPLRVEQDLWLLRCKAGELARESGFGMTELTKLLTAVSEIGRNTIMHGRGGTVRIECIAAGDRRGIRLTFEDCGMGIADLRLALTDGWSSTGSMGLGLGGARRLMCEFDLVSTPRLGTRVIMTKWKY